MKFIDLYQEAIFWTCYLENCPEPERYLNIYGLNRDDLFLFDNLGIFFPFHEFYVRRSDNNTPRMIDNLDSSKKNLILPWMYWPMGSKDTYGGKQIICPPAEIFTLLDNKIETKKIFMKLGIPTPGWSLAKNGKEMLEKPIQNSAGGLGIKLTVDNPGEGCFLEDYIADHQSIGLQFFVYDEVEFICANEMMFHLNGKQMFTFHAQKNIPLKELPPKLTEECMDLGSYLMDMGYKGFWGVDALVGHDGHYLLEINPRGIAFLPAFFAASAHGWTNFITYMNKGDVNQQEIVLVDFGKSRKVVKVL